MHQSFLNKQQLLCLEEKLLHTRLFDTGLKTLLEFGEFPQFSTRFQESLASLGLEISAGPIPGRVDSGIDSFGVFVGEREDSIHKSEKRFRTRFPGGNSQNHAKTCSKSNEPTTSKLSKRFF
jgi:hypothetical protein